MVITYCEGEDQPGKVANPALGQLNKENECSLSRSGLRIWSRETASAVPSRVSLLISIPRLTRALTSDVQKTKVYLPIMLKVYVPTGT